MDDGVERTLAATRALVLPALRAGVDTLPESLRLVVQHHLGWSDDAAPGGKMVRPALALLSARAVGGSARAAVPAAVAVELVHDFSLLHDDIVDGDRVRRHRPTAWVAFGVPKAILAGDALCALAVRVAADAHPEAVGALAAGLRGLMDGQAADLDFQTRLDVTLPECERMVSGKTAALLRCACAMGAMAGGGSRHQVDTMADFGEHLGMAFQFTDDILGIWGDPAVTGKPAASDIANRKKSLPVVAALDAPGASELRDLYALPRPLTEEERLRATELIERAGARRWAQHRVEHHLGEALALLDKVEPEQAAADDLVGLTHALARRDR